MFPETLPPTAVVMSVSIQHSNSYDSEHTEPTESFSDIMEPLGRELSGDLFLCTKQDSGTRGIINYGFMCENIKINTELKKRKKTCDKVPEIIRPLL